MLKRIGAAQFAAPVFGAIACGRRWPFCLILAAMPSQAIPSLFDAVVPAPFGAVGVRIENDAIRELVYLPASHPLQDPQDALSLRAAQQLQAYFSDPDFRFDLPLAPAGTAFQQRVWNVISGIPRGETLTYGAVAKLLRSAPRAVGQACGANWFPMVIPCHRVLAAGGLGGFANSDEADGFHLGVKRWLLAHEQVKGY
jgi:methylated-DNA-[protein]-cysteine S-methyltransferase